MSTIKRNLIIAAVVVIALSITFVLSPLSRQAAPEISFVDIDNNARHMSDYRGKPTLVVFWATDCPGCIQEIPELITLHKEYEDLNMLAVAMPHDSLEHIEAMRQQRGLPYQITWDKSGNIARAFGNVRVTPTHFLISPEGEIVMRKIGALSIAQVQQRLAEMGLSVKHS
jgi:peroxiredoxin